MGNFELVERPDTNQERGKEMTHDQEREKFEKWFVKHISGAPMLEKENNGEYSHMPTRIRWQAWQAAKREPVVSLDSTSVYVK